MEFSKIILTSLLIFSCFATILISFYSEQISNFFNLVDKPDFKRKMHQKNIPITGSMPLVFIFLITLLINIFFDIIKDFDYQLILISSLFIYIIKKFY